MGGWQAISTGYGVGAAAFGLKGTGFDFSFLVCARIPRLRLYHLNVQCSTPLWPGEEPSPAPTPFLCKAPALKRNRSHAHYLLAVRGAESTMSPEDAIDRILELSAEAQTKRREAAENSSAFHKLTGAVLASGQALDLITRLRKQPSWKQASPRATVTALGYSYLKLISAIPGIKRT